MRSIPIASASDIEETWGQNLGHFGVGPVEDVAIFLSTKNIVIAIYKLQTENDIALHFYELLLPINYVNFQAYLML